MVIVGKTLKNIHIFKDLKDETCSIHYNSNILMIYKLLSLALCDSHYMTASFCHYMTAFSPDFQFSFPTQACEKSWKGHWSIYITHAFT